MEFQIDAQMYLFAPLITGIVEIVKQAIPTIMQRTWTSRALSGALGLAAGLVYGPGGLQSDILTGVVLALMANGLYDTVKPIGQLPTPAEKP